MATYFGNSNDNILTGSVAADILFGFGGNDTINGGAGPDIMIGGSGNDYYWVDSPGDVTIEGIGEGSDTVQSSISYSLLSNVETLILSGANNINATGNDDNNTLTGNDGNNTLDGGEGIDMMQGGIGDDIYIVDNSGDGVVEAADQGTDRVNASISYNLGAHVENLTLTGALSVNGVGNTLVNVITGNGAANTLSGDAGNDNLSGGGGNDALHGGDDHDVLSGEAGNDALYGDNGDDALNGGSGDDYLQGDAGADTYTFTYGSGNDTLNNSIGETIGVANQDVVRLAGVAKTDVVLMRTVNTLDLVIGLKNPVSGVVQDTLTLTNYFSNAEQDGDANYAVSQILFDDDTSVASPFTVGYTLIATAEQSGYLLGSNGADNLQASDVGNDLRGYGGDDVLTGGFDSDTLFGDGVTPWSLVFSSDSFASGNDLLYGGGGADYLYGGDGNDYLDGGSGNDYLEGGDGNDTYLVNTSYDQVVESSNEGTDEVRSAVSYYTLTAEVENLLLVGSAYRGNGNSLDNSITGNDANNVLDGGEGADALQGGKGDDTYLVDNAGDVVTENTNEGTDTVQSSINYALTYNLENLTLTGAAISGYGNTRDNTIIGNDANNTLGGGIGNDVLDGGAGADALQGGLGADSMIGGDGSDIYFVDNIGDTVDEANADLDVGGRDTVYSALASYTLGANVENLRILNTDAANATGNALNNILMAGSGNNVIDGDAGSDSASYVFATAGVTVSLAVATAQATGGSGSDTLLNIENLTGSNFNDNLTGNSGNNVLLGGIGKDILTGGLGLDKFKYAAASESGITAALRDVIQDFGGGDKIDLSVLDADSATGGDQAFSAFAQGLGFSGSFAAQASLFFDQTAQILYGNNDADAAADFAIELVGVVSMTLGDFVA